MASYCKELHCWCCQRVQHFMCVAFHWKKCSLFSYCVIDRYQDLNIGAVAGISFPFVDLQALKRWSSLLYKSSTIFYNFSFMWINNVKLLQRVLRRVSWQLSSLSLVSPSSDDKEKSQSEFEMSEFIVTSSTAEVAVVSSDTKVKVVCRQQNAAVQGLHAHPSKYEINLISSISENCFKYFLAEFSLFVLQFLGNEVLL